MSRAECSRSGCSCASLPELYCPARLSTTKKGPMPHNKDFCPAAVWLTVSRAMTEVAWSDAGSRAMILVMSPVTLLVVPGGPELGQLLWA